MKKILAFLLALTMLLCACGSEETEASTEESTEASQEVTGESSEEVSTEMTEEQTEEQTEATPVVYRNPLNGEILDAPYTGRVFAYSISNTSDALPHVGVVYADILMEMFVNDSVVRCLALYSDLSQIDAIGSTRSTRLMFNDIAQHYDAILCHASGSAQVLADLSQRGIDNFNVEHSNALKYGASYRDTYYQRGNVHSLFGIGEGILAYCEAQGFRLTQPEDKDYGLLFTEDGTPEGDDATNIVITLTFSSSHKKTTMTYDEELGQYVYYQYKQMMTDQITGQTEAYENVIIMYADISLDGRYQVTDFTQGGAGYYACGGKIIPITWTCADEDSPFCYYTMDGEQLVMGEGRTYIAITDIGSNVSWE